jgi:hypothetical protein
MESFGSHQKMRDQNIHRKKSCYVLWFSTSPPKFLTRKMICDGKIWDETLMEDGMMLCCQIVGSRKQQVFSWLRMMWLLLIFYIVYCLWVMFNFCFYLKWLLHVVVFVLDACFVVWLGLHKCFNELWTRS